MMANDGGVWTKIWPEAEPVAAVISGHNGATVETGKVIDGKTYDVYTFTDDTATDLSLTVGTPGAADLLLLGGGGAGGCGHGGGGGAGALMLLESVLLPAGSLDVTVGKGGEPGRQGSEVPTDGLPTILGPYVSMGGGVGGSGRRFEAQGEPPGRGGSGGGGGGIYAVAFSPTHTNGAQPSIPSYGNAGGNGHPNDGQPYTGGGGGGAGTAGSNYSGNTGGKGGDGLDVSDFMGLPAGGLVLAGGGGGCSESGAGGAGGSGGASDGVSMGEEASPADPNTGSGGGGARTNHWSGAGGSGIVIVRVRV